MDNNKYEINYFHIDCKNEINTFTEEERSEFLLNVYNSFASLEEDFVGVEINKYFNQLLPKNNSDLLLVNFDLADKYYKGFKFTSEELIMNVNKIISTDFHMNFVFNPENVHCLATIIVFIYQILNSKPYKARLNSKKLQLKNFNNLLNLISKAKDEGLDLIKNFIDKEKFKQSSFISEFPPKGMSFIKRSIINSDDDYMNNRFEKYSKNTNFQQYTQKYSNLIAYTYPKPIEYINEEDFIIPLEMTLLLEHFQSIKTLTFSIEEVDSKIKYEILLILLNLKWLFFNVLEINYEISNEKIQQDLNKIFEYRLNKVMKNSQLLSTRNAYDIDLSGKKKIKEKELLNCINSSKIDRMDTTVSNFYLGQDEDEDTRSSISDINSSYFHIMNNKSTLERSSTKSTLDNLLIKDTFVNSKGVPEIRSITAYTKKYPNFFECIIIYSYFIGELKNLTGLNLRFQDTFNEEIEKMLTASKIFLINFSFLNFLKLENLKNFTISFNSLDMRSFEKILWLINKNSNLKKLSVSLFAPEGNYSSSSLYKLCSSLKMNLDSILRKYYYQEKNNKLAETEEIDELLIKKLLQNFQENLEKLFFLFQTKKTLTDLSIILDIPSIMTQNDLFILILLKFIINIFIFIGFEDNSITSISIIAPYLKFDNRRFPMVDQLLSEIIWKDANIKQMELQIQLYKVKELKNLIPYHLQLLNIGDLDYDSFYALTEFITSEEFSSVSELIYLKISLNLVIINESGLINQLKKLIKLKIKNLKDLILKTYLRFENESELHEFINFIVEEKGRKNCIIYIDSQNNVLIRNLKLKLINKLSALYYILKKYTSKGYKDIELLIRDSIKNILSFINYFKENNVITYNPD